MRLRWVVFKLFKHEERAQLTATWCSILSYFHNDVHKHNLVRNWLCKAMGTLSKMFDIFGIVFLTKTDVHMHTWQNSWTYCLLRQLYTELFPQANFGDKFALQGELSTISKVFDISLMAFHKLCTHKEAAELTASCKKQLDQLFLSKSCVTSFELPNVKIPTLILIIIVNFTACAIQSCCYKSVILCHT